MLTVLFNYPIRYGWQSSPDVHLGSRDSQLLLSLSQSCRLYIPVTLIREPSWKAGR